MEIGLTLGKGKQNSKPFSKRQCLKMIQYE